MKKSTSVTLLLIAGLSVAGCHKKRTQDWSGNGTPSPTPSIDGSGYVARSYYPWWNYHHYYGGAYPSNNSGYTSGAAAGSMMAPSESGVARGGFGGSSHGFFGGS